MYQMSKSGTRGVENSPGLRGELESRPDACLGMVHATPQTASVGFNPIAGISRLLPLRNPARKHVDLPCPRGEYMKGDIGRSSTAAASVDLMSGENSSPCAAFSLIVRTSSALLSGWFQL